MISNLDAYKVFYYVARYRNITLAGKALFLTQPTVSHYILNLEKELSCQLFLRSKKGVTLTPEGEILYHHIAKAYSEIFRGEDELKEYLHLNKGLIKIGASETSLRNYLIPVLGRFRTKYPNVQLRITNTTGQLAADSIKSAVFDLAVMTTPFPPTDLTVTPLQSFSMSIIAGTAFSHLTGHALSYQELIQYPLICLESGTAGRYYMDTLFASHGLPLHPDIELSTADLITPLAEENMGIGFVPAIFAEHAISNGRVIRLTLEDTPPTRSICVITDPNRQLPLACRQFLGELTTVQSRTDSHRAGIECPPS